MTLHNVRQEKSEGKNNNYTRLSRPSPTPHLLPFFFFFFNFHLPPRGKTCGTVVPSMFTLLNMCQNKSRVSFIQNRVRITWHPTSFLCFNLQPQTYKNKHKTNKETKRLLLCWRETLRLNETRPFHLPCHVQTEVTSQCIFSLLSISLSLSLSPFLMGCKNHFQSIFYWTIEYSAVLPGP